jgi:hypothetical protein
LLCNQKISRLTWWTLNKKVKVKRFKQNRGKNRVQTACVVRIGVLFSLYAVDDASES